MLSPTHTRKRGRLYRYYVSQRVLKGDDAGDDSIVRRVSNVHPRRSGGGERAGGGGRYQRMLDEGRYASISEMAAAVGAKQGYLWRILLLTLLAPDIVEAILDGAQPVEIAPWG